MTSSVIPRQGPDVSAQDRRRGMLLASALVALTVTLFSIPLTVFVASIAPGLTWLVPAGIVLLWLLVLVGLATEILTPDPT